MTYTTRVAIAQPVPIRELLDFINAELLHADTVQVDDRPGRLGNEPDQGLDAWVWINYSPDGPLRAEESEDGERTCAIELCFDTSYGFEGLTPEAQHQLYLEQLRPWFDERGVEVSWQGECAFEVMCYGDLRRVLS